MSVYGVTANAPRGNIGPSVRDAFRLKVLHRHPSMGIILRFRSRCTATISYVGGGPSGFGMATRVPYRMNGRVPVVPCCHPNSPTLTGTIIRTVGRRGSMLLAGRKRIMYNGSFSRMCRHTAFFRVTYHVVIRSKKSCSILAPRRVSSLRMCMLKGGAG